MYNTVQLSVNHGYTRALPLSISYKHLYIKVTVTLSIYLLSVPKDLANN